MLVNYILIAIRNLRKHFTYSLINIVGLSLGLTTCLLLVLWIRHELSYDHFHEKKGRIYRAALEYSFGGQTAGTTVSPTALLPALQKNFAEVETGARLFNASSYNPFIIRYEDKLFEESRFYFADSTLFDVFTFRLIRGDKQQALAKPQSIVITQPMAVKYFGSEDPIGKVLLVNNRAEYTVTGVLDEVPSNSMLKFDFIASFSSHPAAKDPIWWSANYQTYVVLRADANVPALQNKINELVKKELANELTNPGDYVKYPLMPLLDIYLRSNMDEPEVVGSIQYVYVFSGIAALVLIIACINYINLATAKAADRAKEVGIRKVVGAVRKQLFLQFVGESLVIVFVSFGCALLLASLCLPFFNNLTGKIFHTTDFLDLSFLSLSIAAIFSIGLVAGAYPAIFITAFKPVQILKGNFKTSGKGVWLRKSLVVFQFSISIILMIGTWVIYNQLGFIQNQRLGFDKENVLILPLDRKTSEVYSTLKNEFIKSGSATSVSRATEVPTRIRGGYSINLPGGSERGMLITAMSVDEEFVRTMNMELVAGRNFTEQDMARTEKDTVYSFLLNERAVQELALSPENAVGTQLTMNGRKGTLVGIVKDFHFSSMHDKIGPLALFTDHAANPQLNYILVKLNQGSITQSLASLKSICENLIPHRPFEYRFVNEKYQSLYVAEQRMGTICTVFASLAIAIACLGLLGLVSFAAAQKTKEIGIRKVMGANGYHIVALFTRDFTSLVLLAVLIGIPASWYLIEKMWLIHFAYRIELTAVPFLGTALFCFTVAYATAGYQALKASLTNPIKTLRSE